MLFSGGTMIFICANVDPYSLSIPEDLVAFLGREIAELLFP
jgi:hypothetical protein